MKQILGLITIMSLTLLNSSLLADIVFNQAVCKKYATPTPFTVHGNLIVEGDITATGDITGKNLIALDTISAFNANITDTLTAANGIFSGNLSANTGTFTNDVSMRDLTARNGTFTGTLNGVNANFSGTIEAKEINVPDANFDTLTADNLIVNDTITLGNPPFSGGAVNINGEVWATGFNTISDARLKENIYTLNTTESLNKICALRPVTFCFTTEAKKSIKVRTCDKEGFIAQEVQKIIPNAVCKSKESDELLAINYEVIIATLVGALQESNKKVEELSMRIDKLEKMAVKNY